MILVQTSDFVGEFKLPADQFNTTILQRIIDDSEAGFIYSIYGADLGNEIIQYISNPIPANPDFDKVIEAFQIDKKRCERNEKSLLVSKGLKFILLSFIYRQFQIEAKTIPTQVGGLSQPNREMSNDIWTGTQIILKYNEAVKSIWAIQEYMKDNRDLYPNMNPQKLLLDSVI